MRMRLIALLAVTWTTGACLAEVFWREKHDVPANWKRAYHTSADLTHGKGEVSVYAGEGNLHQTAEQLRALHGADLILETGDQAGWGLLLADGNVSRYFLQEHPEGEGTLITRVTQDEREAGLPGTTPDKHQLRELPLPPNSQPTYYMRNADTKMALEISSTTAPPFSVLETMSESLRADGWEEALPVNGGGRMFLKKNRVAMVSAERAEDGFTRVLRLHKPLGVK